MNTIESPGSLKDFAESRDLNTLKAMHEYSMALDEYRHRLANFFGISIDELHDNFRQQKVDGELTDTFNINNL